MRIGALAAALLLLAGTRAEAQDYDGYASTLFTVMPDVDADGGRQAVAEARARLFAEVLFDPGDRVHVRAGAFLDALLGDRGVLDDDGAAAEAVIRPADIYAEYRGERVDLRAGMSRVVWGRLDEFQPTDVVNPIDLSRFLLEGRSEARLPVALVRGRLFLPRATLEALVVPVFRAGAFDQLGEETSPFLLAPAGTRERREPGISWRNVQGGARLTSTLGRVDVGVSAWRGFESLPDYVPRPVNPDAPALAVPAWTEVFPRFTMVGGDFETVHGPWGVRGEAAWFDGPRARSFEGGIGADRRAGEYRVALNAVVSHGDGTDVTLVGWAERAFARETRTARLLAVYDPSNDAAFVRGIGAVSLRDNLWLEASAGWFAAADSPTGGQGTAGVLGLLTRRDFLYVRMKHYF